MLRSGIINGCTCRNSKRKWRKCMKLNPKLLAASTAFCIAAIGAGGNALAQKKGEFATKDEAVAMVKKGVAFIKKEGKDKGYAEITNKKGQFTDRDLYLVVYGLDGVVRA